MDVTIVIPAYNPGDFLKDQLEALTTQRWDGSWEVVVVDNGSTDGTAELAWSFSSRLPIHVVDASTRRCRAAACNAGVAVASGASVLFLDADDIVDSRYVATMHAALSSNDFVASRLECDSLNEGWVRAVRTPAQVTGLGKGAFPYAYGGSLGIRRSIFETVGTFDENLRTAEDIDFCYRVALAGIHLTYVPEAVLKYRFRGSLTGIWHQAYAYGVGGAEIRRRYGEYGEPGENLVGTARLCAGLFRMVLRRGGKGSRARALYILANRVGRLRGRMGRTIRV